MKRPELSIVIPFLNEEKVLPLLHARLEKLKQSVPDLELIFVSDGSTDGSCELVESWAETDQAVKLVALTRNFGHQSAVSAGLAFSSGAVIGIMDADLQDEPEILLEMFHLLQSERIDVVYAVRSKRDENKMKSLSYFLFYRLFLFLADSPVQLDSGDFCVMSRRAVQLLLTLPEKLRFVRGLRAWLGLPAKAFPISRPARVAGTPQYSLGQLVKLGLAGLTSFSTRPLRLGFICGSFLCLAASIAALIYLGFALFTDTRLAAPGFSTLVVILLFSNGMIFLYLGVLGEYIGQIFMEVKARPSYLVERMVNLPQPEHLDE
jgi:polyisoprenyl-phosphate glycosyltransferase